MSIAPRQLTGLILHKYQPSQAANIITLYQGGDNPTTIAARAEENFRGAACFLKNLRLQASVPSLPAKTPPIYSLEDEDSTRLVQALDLEWTGDRYELNLWAAKSTGSWFKIGAVSLINLNGYAYRTYNLLDLTTDNLAQELGIEEKIGYSMVDVGKGLPTAADEILISGSWLEEIYTENLARAGGSVAVDLSPVLDELTSLQSKILALPENFANAVASNDPFRLTNQLDRAYKTLISKSATTILMARNDGYIMYVTPGPNSTEVNFVLGSYTLKNLLILMVNGYSNINPTLKTLEIIDNQTEETLLPPTSFQTYVSVASTIPNPAYINTSQWVGRTVNIKVVDADTSQWIGVCPIPIILD